MVYILTFGVYTWILWALEYFRILCCREWIQNPAQFGSHWHCNRGYGASLPRGTKPVDFLEHRDQNLATLKPFPKTHKNSLDIHLNYSNYSCSGRSRALIIYNNLIILIPCSSLPTRASFYPKTANAMGMRHGLGRQAPHQPLKSFLGLYKTWTP